jgi:hypothetical protein
VQFDRAEGTVNYTAAGRGARLIRLGLHDGPLLRTWYWKPRPRGW